MPDVRRALVAVALPALLVGACASDGDDTGDPTPEPEQTADAAACEQPDDCPLRVVAGGADVLIGTAVQSDLLESEPAYAEMVAAEFNSVTPENALKWDAVHPEPDTWTFEDADAIVDFAAEHDVAVKGHNLVWAQELVDSTPDWVEEIDAPDELRSALEEHITTVMEHFDTVDRWDVVNEPLQTTGTELYDNHFHRVLGPGYVAEAFEMARSADPDAALYLNENIVEYSPGKRDAFVELVTDLVDDGVPIDGVGLQLHLVNGAPEAGVVSDLVETFTDLDLEVAITELDVPLRESDDLSSQAAVFDQVVEECVGAGCRDVTLWGFTDKHTWIDSFLGPGLEPLILDDDYAPKPAYDALWQVFAAQS